MKCVLHVHFGYKLHTFLYVYEVILGVRNGEKWYNSMVKGLYPKLHWYDWMYWNYLLDKNHRNKFNLFSHKN